MSISKPETQTVPAWAAEGCPAAEGAAPQKAKADPFLCGTVYRISGWRRWFLLYPASWLLRLYYASLRVRMDPEEEKILRDSSRPLVFVIWHNRSFVAPMILRDYRRREKCFCLISPSKAAAWEASMFELLGIPSARGSSSRRSIVAMRELLKGFEAGNDICISPDGPTGPRYEFKRGAAVAARLTKASVLLVGADSQSAWRPNTWDRHFLPLPFSRVTLRAKRFENAEIFDGAADEAVTERLARELNFLNDDHGKISG